MKRDGFGLEADTLRFIGKNTTIPVPRVLVSAVGGGYQYMLMRRVRGVNLQRVWKTLSVEQRDRIISQLHSFVKELRTLAPPPCVPPGAICSLYNQPLSDARIRSPPCGPFPSEKLFNDLLVQEASRFFWHTELEEIRAEMRDDHQIVFTHGDLTPRNIIVDGDRVTGLIDWEDSGWFPEHWEVVKGVYCTGIAPDEWQQAIERIVPGDYSRDLHTDRRITARIEGAI